MSLPPAVRHAGAVHCREGSRSDVRRALCNEVPVALVYGGTTQAVMMATPADLEDFAIGFSLSEGVIASADEVQRLDVLEHPQGIEVQMWLSDDRAEALAARRRFMAGPVGCGLCGIDSLAEALRPLPDVSASGPALGMPEVAAATEALRAWQPLHDRTGAVHAAGYLLPGQGIVLAREDVGRHNALDKLIGAMARQGMPRGQGAVILTSRISVEMVQKCAMAGTGMLIAVSAPTARALQLAEEAGITLAAFARAGSFDLFTHTHRISTEVHDVA